MKMTVNSSDFIRVVESKKAATKAGVKLGVGAILVEIGARADELVPFDTGTLSRSQTTKVTTTKETVTGVIGYGGPAAPYALVQHEDSTLSHPPKTKGGSPVAPGQGRGMKYLEYPTNQIRPRVNKIIRHAIKSVGG